MLPTREEALFELETAGKMNPGPWVNHSLNVGIAAGNIAERIPGMDAQKAYVVGLMHDIGRRVGVVDIPTHVYEGFRYCMGKGWDETARICMTHSYLRMRDEFCNIIEFAFPFGAIRSDALKKAIVMILQTCYFLLKFLDIIVLSFQFILKRIYFLLKSLQF